MVANWTFETQMYVKKVRDDTQKVHTGEAPQELLVW